VLLQGAVARPFGPKLAGFEQVMLYAHWPHSSGSGSGCRGDSRRLGCVRACVCMATGVAGCVETGFLSRFLLLDLFFSFRGARVSTCFVTAGCVCVCESDCGASTVGEEENPPSLWRRHR
jgi:hypothetical protein